MNAIIPSKFGKIEKRGRGRPPESPNRVNSDLLEMLQQAMKLRYGLDRYDPVVALAEIACDSSNPVEIRMNAHAKVAPYVRAQLKQVEITGANGGAIEVKTSLIDVITASLDHGDDK